MRISIIDLGTQSIKHSIFEAARHEKGLLYYKRYSGANLGQETLLSPETIERASSIIKACLAKDSEFLVSTRKVVGTDILRKAPNSNDFLELLKKNYGLQVQILSQGEEATYLYRGLQGIIPKNTPFAAVNIGGGSTEIVFGDYSRLEETIRLPFGVKRLSSEFCENDVRNWGKVDAFLQRELPSHSQRKLLFITGVLDFFQSMEHFLDVQANPLDVAKHPTQITLPSYRKLVMRLRETPIEVLRKNYAKDPDFCNNVAFGQSTYLALAEKISAETIVPSSNDLTDGLLDEILVG